MSESARAYRRTVILLSNDLSHPALARQQLSFSWRINRLRPLMTKGYTVMVVAAGGRVGEGGRPSLSSLKPAVRNDGRMVLVSPPLLRVPMLWLIQSMIATPLMVLLYCRTSRLKVEAIVAASVPYGAVAKVLNRLLKASLIVDYGDPDYARERSLSLRVLHFLEACVLGSRGADAVTCIDPNIRDYVRRYGVDAKFLPPGGFWNDLREPSLEEASVPKTVVYAGHVAPPPAYRLDLLVEAAPKILADNPDTTILVVGDGAYLPALKARAARMGLGDRFRFTGGVPYDQAKRYIAQASVAVQLLNDMCLGTKVVDYFAAGKAVVSSGSFCGSYDEFLHNGENCLLVPPDPDALAAAVGRLLSDSRLRTELGRNARETVRKYDWNSQAEALLSLISSKSSPGIS